MPHFVLDQNFPWQTTGLDWPYDIRITPLPEIDPALTRDHDDWEVLLALNGLAGVDGFITNDNMLSLVRELVVLHRSHLTLVVAGEVGHLPIIATGLVMVYLPQIARTLSRRPEIYKLNAGAASTFRSRPYDRLQRMGNNIGVSADELILTELREIQNRQGQFPSPASEEEIPRRPEETPNER